jgi:hypothetical protein
VLLASVYACTGGDPELSASDGDAGSAGNDGATDTGAKTDASGDDAADAGTTWCSMQTSHQFCADFDRTPYDKGFTHFEKLGGTVVENIADFQSPPRSVTAGVPAGAGSKTAPIQGTLGVVLTATPGTAEASFSMRIRTAADFQPFTDAGPNDAAVVAIVSAGDSDFVFLQYGANGFALIAGSVSDAGVNVTLASIAPKLDQWVTVRIVAKFTTSATGSVELFLDGQSAAKLSGIATIVGATPTSVGLALGPTIYEKSPGVSVSYDNVLFDNN